ncbi:MAG TPA: histidine phosphatase family protein [Steroidobacteraceae bacterium]|nr:histidine phosphatase family protein [Steroidobacteraceae bacterium]
MRRLTLVRHAKSDWKNSDLKDFDRPLNRRGQKEAPQMAELLAAQQVRVDLLLTSPAVRALETARLFARALNYPPRRLKSDERLYLAQPKEILEVVRGIGSRVRHLMLVGHNPGLSEFAQALSNDSELGELPTSAVYAVDLDIRSWGDAKFGDALNPSLMHPKSLLDLLR